jgi:phosphoglycolate phosphatase
LIPWPRAIIWDLDGTLIDSAADLTAALNRLLLERGLGRLPRAAVRPMIGDGAAALVDRGFRAAGAPLSAEHRKTTVRRFLCLYAENAVRETRAFDGALAVMDALTRAGCVHAVCTNKPRAISALILDRLGFAERTEALIGAESTTHNKPHPAPLLSCLRRLDVPGDVAVMIGDSAVDVLAARAAGLPVVVVSFGYSRQPVQNLGADAIVEHLDQIPGVIAQLASTTSTRRTIPPTR